MGLLNIIYEDDELVAIDKPTSLIVHRTRISRDSVCALQLLRDQIGQFVYPLHRLDRPTSGVLIFAKDKGTASAFGELFSSRSVDKVYFAAVRGTVEESGVIDHMLRDPDTGKEQDCLTEYSRVDFAEIDDEVGGRRPFYVSTVRVVPRSGRMHQIRRHLKHLFHPIIGDTKYGDGKVNRYFRDNYEINRLMLHCAEMSFVHPADSRSVSIRSDLPSEFALIENIKARPPEIQ